MKGSVASLISVREDHTRDEGAVPEGHPQALSWPPASKAAGPQQRASRPHTRRGRALRQPAPAERQRENLRTPRSPGSRRGRGRGRCRPPFPDGPSGPPAPGLLGQGLVTSADTPLASPPGHGSCLAGPRAVRWCSRASPGGVRPARCARDPAPSVVTDSLTLLQTQSVFKRNFHSPGCFHLSTRSPQSALGDFMHLYRSSLCPHSGHRRPPLSHPQRTALGTSDTCWFPRPRLPCCPFPPHRLPPLSLTLLL